MCPLQLWWTAYAASTQHQDSVRESTKSIRGMFMVPFKYPSTCLILPQLSSSGVFTCIVRKVVAGCMLHLACVLRNNSYAVAWWNAIACSSGNGLAFELSCTLKRWSATRLVFVVLFLQGIWRWCSWYTLSCAPSLFLLKEVKYHPKINKWINK